MTVINRNDCVVRALFTVLSDTFNYEYINTWLLTNGWRRSDTSRTVRGGALAFLQAHGIGYKHHYRKPSHQLTNGLSKKDRQHHVKDDLFDGKTLKTFQDEKYKGRFLVSVRGHVIAICDGRSDDWANGRLNRILSITYINDK